MGSGSGWARGASEVADTAAPRLPTGVQSLIASRWESQQDSIASPQSEAWRCQSRGVGKRVGSGYA